MNTKPSEKVILIIELKILSHISMLTSQTFMPQSSM